MPIPAKLTMYWGFRKTILPLFRELVPQSGSVVWFRDTPRIEPPSVSDVWKSAAVSQAFREFPARVVRQPSDQYPIFTSVFV
jgi:hypothetical protein